MEEIKRSKHRLISASSSAVNSLAFPLVQVSHKAFFKGTSLFASWVDSAMNTLDNATNESLSWFSGSIRSFATKAELTAHSGIASSYETLVNGLTSLHSSLANERVEVENYFKTNGIDLEKSLISSESWNLVVDIYKFINLYRQDLPNISIIEFIKYLQAYSSMQNAEEKTVNRFIEWVDIKNEVELLDMLYYRKYAMAIYGKNVINILVGGNYLDILRSIPDREIFARHCGIEENDIFVCRFSSDKFTPGHVLSVDHSTRNLVLTIRGTYSIHDVFTDINAEHCDYTYISLETQITVVGTVHSGMMTCASVLSQMLKQIVIDESKRFDGYNLVLAGHSLGGAVASLLTLMWSSDPELSHLKIKTFTYGCPCVVSNSLNEILNEKVLTTMHGNDMFAEFSIGHIRNLCKIIEKLKLEEDSGNIDINWLINAGEDDIPRVYELWKFVFENLQDEVLQPAGKIYHFFDEDRHLENIVINKPENFRFCGGWAIHDLYSKIHIIKSSFRDHRPDIYEDALRWISENIN